MPRPYTALAIPQVRSRRGIYLGRISGLTVAADERWQEFRP
jgi:hypothetical protein